MSSNRTDRLTLTLQNTTTNKIEEDETSAVIYSGFILIPIIMLAVVGNSLTICCFLRDKGLHKTCNIYILNLAICDLLIGAITMPIYLTYTFSNNVWLLGYHFCKAFLAFDFVTSGVTVILMILISYDRLTLLKHWSTYHNSQSRRKAYIKCMMAWIYLIILNVPPIVGWDLWTGHTREKSDDCEAEFVDNEIFISTMAFIQFVIPLVILIIIHILIVKEIRKLILAREELTYIPSHNGSQHSYSTIQLDIKKDKCFTRTKKNYEQSKGNRQTTKGTKAAKSLAILTIVFFLTWAPYAIVVVVRSFCPNCTHIVLIEAFTWILWFKSAVNPFLYAFNSNRFRENFKYFLCCRRREYKPTSC